MIIYNKYMFFTHNNICKLKLKLKITFYNFKNIDKVL